VSAHEDKVWFDAGCKLHGICQDIADAEAGGSNVLILAHFKDTLAILEEALRTRSIEYKTFLTLDFSSLCSRRVDAASPGLWVGLASYFESRSLSAADKFQPPVQILAAEHHPLASKDQALLDVARSLPCEARVIFHSSLMDPLLTHLGGEKIRGLMKHLGMGERDCVSHPVISTAIRSAQKKIESKIHREMQTLSAEDWFKYNLAKQ
jgi:preprotein translocase subunit SecA